MRAPTSSAALRTIFSSSQSQSSQFIGSRRFATSKHSTFSLSKQLRNNDPAGSEESHIVGGVVAAPKQGDKIAEVEEVTENTNGPQTPARPRDHRGYEPPARRAGRHVRKSKAPPPLKIPKWFFEENVVLREDGSDHISIRPVLPEITESSQSNKQFTSPIVVLPDESWKEKERNLEEAIENVGRAIDFKDGQSPINAPDAENIGLKSFENNKLDKGDINIQNDNNRSLQDNAIKFVNSSYQVSSKNGTYEIDASIMHDICFTVSSNLLSPPMGQVDGWVSSKPDLVLFHPNIGGSYFLDALVQHFANINDADLVRLDPQDIAEIGGNYIEEKKESHLKSLSSLGYDAYQGDSIHVSQELEENAEEDDVNDLEDENGRSRIRSTYQSPNIKVIPVARIGNIMDILGHASTESNSAGEPKSSPNFKIFGQNIDTTRDSRISQFIEAILKANELKRNFRNDTDGFSHFNANESTTKDITENSKTKTDTVDEIEIKNAFDTTLKYTTDFPPIIIATDKSKPFSGSLIVMIRDYMEINTTSSGGKFLEKMHEIVKIRRKEGQRVIIIGTSTSKEFLPSFSKAEFQTIEAEPEIGPTRTIITPCHNQSSKGLAKNHKLRIKNINFRNLQTMLRRLSPTPSHADSLKLTDSAPSLLLEEVGKELWPLDFTHHLATITLGMKKGEGKLDETHIYQALMILLRSEKAKYDWMETEKAEEKKNTKPVKQLVDGLGDDNLRFMSSGESEERMKKLQKSCNTYEKKLLNGVVDPGSIRTTFADVRAPIETVRALKTLTSLSLVRPDAFTYGVLATDRIPGILLYGPPGTGKTLLAKAVAKESGATVLEVSGSDIYDMYVGEGEKNVKAIFSLAKKLAPCIVFIDEADAILGSRGSSSNRTTHRELINQFLREWDGMNELSAFIMVATNRPFDLDEASLRRLPRRLLVDLPTEKDREAILKIHLKDEILDSTVSLATIASQTPFYSGSDLKNLAVAAALSCVREEFDQAAASKSNESQPYEYPEKRTLLSRHFASAMEEISASISEDMGSLSAIRKFDEKYGDRRGRRKRRGAYGFETAKEGEEQLSDAARVRNRA